MRAKLITFIVILVFVVAGVTPQTAHAQNPAYTTKFATAITYQNVGSAATTTLHILFYASPSDTSPIDITRPNLAAGASSSVSVNSLISTTPYQGSAVMLADQPILVTLVQVPQSSTTVYGRPLSDAFSSATDTVLIASVLKNSSHTNSIVSFQNADTQANDFDIKFFDTSANLAYELTPHVEAGATYIVDAYNVAGLGTTFTGSAVATAKRGDATPGKIVGTSMELDTIGTPAAAFEGVGQGSLTVYMPSASCKAFSQLQTVNYAVQNTSLTNSTNVTVTYEPGGLTDSYTIGPGAKHSFLGCNTIATGFSGSAIITSDTQPIIALGKVSGGGLSADFIGQPNGFANLSLPYVRWAPTATYQSNPAKQRTTLAIQNVGASTIPANSITLTFSDSFGHNGTYTYASDLAVGAKFNANATNAGLTWFGMSETTSNYGGGVIINCTAPNCQLIAIGRVASYVSSTYTAAEDYNGMQIP